MLFINAALIVILNRKIKNLDKERKDIETELSEVGRLLNHAIDQQRSRGVAHDQGYAYNIWSFKPPSTTRSYDLEEEGIEQLEKRLDAAREREHNTNVEIRALKLRLAVLNGELAG